MGSVIEVSNVTKTYRMYNAPKDRFKEALGIGRTNQYYKLFYALKNISFEIGKGEIVGIIGRNGSGKSTLLKILTGVINASEGNVKIDGKVAALLELGAGFNMEYTGMKNIYLNATMMRVSRSEIEKRIPDILEFADIGDYINQPVKTYSSGMFVRLAFAVAIHVDPDILIVDEALAVGDARFQLKCMNKFMEFVDAGKTILFVTHDINAVKRFCNRAIWLNQGSLILDGDVDDVTDRYNDFLKSDLSIAEYLAELEDKKNGGTLLQEKETFDVSHIDLAEIHELHIYNSAGREIQEIIHGEKIIVKVSYLVGDENIEKPVLGVAIRRIDNEYICGLNTKLDNKIIPWQRGYNEFFLIYKNFNLVGGEYYFEVGLFDKTAMVILNYKSKMKPFVVKMNYIAEGVVVLSHEWGKKEI